MIRSTSTRRSGRRSRNAASRLLASCHRSPTPHDFSGLALSGGGIRSATFNLGVLQALNRAGLLENFDYLSTVSGGGYVGGWWSAWLTRSASADRPLFPDDEGVETWRHRARRRNPEADSPAEPDPIHHVRLFSNYLTPRKGALSPDLWRAVTIAGRNLILTWAALVPFLAMGVVLGQAAFLWVFGRPETLADRAGAVLSLPVAFLGWFVVLCGGMAPPAARRQQRTVGHYDRRVAGDRGGHRHAASRRRRTPPAVLIISTLVIAVGSGTGLLDVQEADGGRQGGPPEPGLAVADGRHAGGACHRCDRHRRRVRRRLDQLPVRERANDEGRGRREVPRAAHDRGQHVPHGAQQRTRRRRRCHHSETALDDLAAAARHGAVVDDARSDARYRLGDRLGDPIARSGRLDVGAP